MLIRDAAPGTAGSSRRRWLAGAGAALAALAAGTRGLADDDAKATAPTERDVADQVAARARAAGLDDLRVERTPLYLGLGNAEPAFQSAALKLCEALAADFLKHFTARRFAAAKPATRMPVVVLADPEAFAAFLGSDPGAAVRGIYDLDAGWLVVCDNRADGGPLAERANSVSLFHEATHQLTYATALLDRRADLPLAVAEGLACYGETRRPDGRTRVGAVNAERLAVLAAAARTGERLIPASDLMVKDSLLEEAGTEQLAYAQAWALVHMLMQPARAGDLREYLARISGRRDAARRLDDVAATLGAPSTLDDDLKSYVNRLLRH